MSDFTEEELPIIEAQEKTVATLLRGLPGSGGHLSAKALRRMARCAFNCGASAMFVNPKAGEAWHAEWMKDGYKYLKDPTDTAGATCLSELLFLLAVAAGIIVTLTLP